MQKSAIITVVLLVFVVVFVIGWNSIEKAMSDSPLLSSQREFIQEVMSEPETPIVTTTVFVLGTDVSPDDILNNWGCRIDGPYGTTALRHGMIVEWEGTWVCDVAYQVYRNCSNYYDTRPVELIKLVDTDSEVLPLNTDATCLQP